MKTAASAYSASVRDLDPDQLVPVHGRAWIECIPPAEETAGGLEIPIGSRPEHNYGIVRAVAKDLTIVKLGDVVVVDSYEGNKIDFGSGRKFLLVDADQIRAKLDIVPVTVP
jgi:co-chaperonin GroES (HSP10)